MPIDENSWIRRLISWGYMVEGANNKVVCTIAGLVLFGSSPRKYLHQAGIRIIVFDGEDKQYKALLDDVLDSPMIGLWRLNDSGQRELAGADLGVIERLIDKIIPFISEESSKIDENFRRKQVWHYPKEAVRELVINALVHRDWTRSVDIEIDIYSNRMEVIRNIKEMILPIERNNSYIPIRQ